MLFVPPRHGKSEMVTVRYPVWRMERDPTMRVIVGAYNQTLAEKFSRKSRRIARMRFTLNEERQASEDWETPQGGGLRAVGVGGGITGQGGHLIVIDDPVKSREEANSQVYRDRVYDWYTDDLYTRREPGAALVLIQTRWHEDDLAGRILASEDGPNWTVVSLPAEAEDADPLGRQPGEALCPQRFDKAALAQIKTVLGLWAYTSLYQQRPQPAEGNLAQRAWFEIVDAAPAMAQGRVRAWDFAATERKAAKSDPDFTAGTRMSLCNGIYYVENVVRERSGPGMVEALLKQTAQTDGPRVMIHLEQEPGSSGKLFVAAMIRLLAGYDVHAETPTGDKITRAMPFMAQAEAGNVKLVRGPWNAAWLDEICAVPNAPHDDQWDSASAAFQMLQKRAHRTGSQRYA